MALKKFIEWTCFEQNAKGSFTPLLQLKKFLEKPVSTREEARESRPHPSETRFRLLAREEGSFPCVVGKKFPAFRSQLKRRRSPQESRDELQCRVNIPRFPQKSQQPMTPWWNREMSSLCSDTNWPGCRHVTF